LRLTDVNSRAQDDLLAGVTIEKGMLKITSIEKSTPPDSGSRCVSTRMPSS
jgi:hypothetical protein